MKTKRRKRISLQGGNAQVERPAQCWSMDFVHNQMLERRSDIHAVFRLMMANQADFNVRTMCRVLKVSASGYYAWRYRAPRPPCLASAVLIERIREIIGESYGMPRVR